MRKVISLLILSLSFVSVAGAQQDSQMAKNFISYTAKGDFSKAQALFAPNLQSQVSPQMLQNIWEQLTQTYGDFENIEKVSITTIDSIKNLLVQTQFKKANILFSLAFKTTHQIIGFHINGVYPKKEEKRIKEGDTAIVVEDGKIYGTLKIPKNKDSLFPVVLIIPGSGAVNRAGNAPPSLQSNTYKMLADSLAYYGIASFRYDKRGVGESKKLLKDESTLQFHTFVDDAKAITDFLKADTLFSKVIIAGHSQGSLVGIMVAQKTLISGFISLDGAGETIDKILLTQLAQDSSISKKVLRDRINRLKSGQKVKNDRQNPIFNPKIQPLLSSWMQINPSQEIKKLRMPVLIINGTTDLQVPVKQARLLAKADPSAKLVLIKGMNHILKNAPKDRKENLETYHNPDLGLNKQLIVHLVSFINHL